jgi:hypothetical protein
MPEVAKVGSDMCAQARVREGRAPNAAIAAGLSARAGRPQGGVSRSASSSHPGPIFANVRSDTRDPCRRVGPSELARNQRRPRVDPQRRRSWTERRASCLRIKEAEQLSQIRGCRTGFSNVCFGWKADGSQWDGLSVTMGSADGVIINWPPLPAVTRRSAKLRQQARIPIVGCSTSIQERDQCCYKAMRLLSMEGRP